MANLHLFILLWVCYFVSLGLMIADLVLSGFTLELVYLYLLTNGILLYRMFGVLWITILLHALIPIAVIICLIILNIYSMLHFIKLTLLIPVVIQMLVALHLVVFRWGRSKEKQAYYCGIHAHMGLVVVIIYFWSVCFVRKRYAVNVFMTMFYMLSFFVIILTPAFYGLSKAFFKFDSDGIHFMTREEAEEAQRAKYSAPGPGHRQYD